MFRDNLKYRREVSGTFKKRSHLPELVKASPAVRWETLVLSSHISKPGVLWRTGVSAAKVNLCQTDLIVKKKKKSQITIKCLKSWNKPDSLQNKTL